MVLLHAWISVIHNALQIRLDVIRRSIPTLQPNASFLQPEQALNHVLHHRMGYVA